MSPSLSSFIFTLSKSHKHDFHGPGTPWIRGHLTSKPSKKDNTEKGEKQQVTEADCRAFTQY